MDDGGRSRVVDALFNELLGPSTDYQADGVPQARPLDTSHPPQFADYEAARGPFVDLATGEEVLRDRPSQRYGVGVLYPTAQEIERAQEEGSEDTEEGAEAAATDELDSENGTRDDAAPPLGSEPDSDDFDLSSTAQYRPSSMAVSFLVRAQPGDTIRLAVSGGRYDPFVAKVSGRERTWWVRRPVSFTCDFPCPTAEGLVPMLTGLDTSPLKLDVQLFARAEAGDWLMTAALVNRASPSDSADRMSLYQSRFNVTVVRSGTNAAAFLPYPDHKSAELLEHDAEARSLDLLYRRTPVFATGHGCAATWRERWGDEASAGITADPLPVFEAPSVTPDVTLEDGSTLAVPMAPLAGLDPGDDGFASMEAVLEAYGDWIDALEAGLEELDSHRRDAAVDHIGKCRRAHTRMAEGLAWIRTDPTAHRAFQLANRSVLEQQLRSEHGLRQVTVDKSGDIVIEARPAIRSPDEAKKSWRAFQIGFLLAAAKPTVVADHANRETVELIFFPTGGGKTEAYQGLAAFALFYRRLCGLELGVDVILRYTLRLLTGQQFLRAAGLVCAMEHIRAAEPGLKDGPGFSIGIWVGQAITPTTRARAIEQARALERGGTDNPFLLLRCPWCGAQMGPVTVASGAPRGTAKSVGYRISRGTVGFRCPDRECEFSSGIPAYVIDEDIYDKRPSILIATIDKFAMLAYRESARKIFGIGDDGVQECEPPNLVIQDELHLISGPLGSIAGIYEAVIEDLCTGGEGEAAARPKIVASTATIRRYQEQIKALYDRDDTALFPPHGLDASDSFFARHAVDPATGLPAQGRIYIGVHAPGLGSMQTAQVRATASLLQAAHDMDPALRDPWWTLMMFFNSLRELGSSVSLFQSDIPDYLRAVLSRTGRDGTDRRLFNEPLQLTSGLRKEALPGALAQLERSNDERDAVDACLASSIIEVGVDVGRLSLLVVVGQPKTTSQYIQVTGRVGRRWQERPGLVVMLYGASKPRDRSHFERFQPYHQRLYAEVEPISATPFAPPVVQRAAHAAVIAYVRQKVKKGAKPWPIPEQAIDRAIGLLEDRVTGVDDEELHRVKAQLARRKAEWEAYEPQEWDTSNFDDAFPLMRRAGQWAPAPVERKSWPVPMSMRDVDAECRGEATDFFSLEALGETDMEDNG